MKKTINMKSSGDVSVAITFGFASVGRYWSWLYDAADQNPQSIGEGASDDDTPDVLQLGAPGALAGRLFFVRCSAASAAGAAGLVGCSLQFSQAGAVVADGSVNLSAVVNPGEQADFTFAIRLVTP